MISPCVRVYIADTGGRQAVKGIAAQIAHEAVAEHIDEIPLHFLRNECEQNAQRKSADHKIDRLKVDLSPPQHGVDRLAVQYGTEQDEPDVQQAGDEDARHISAVRAHIMQQPADDILFEPAAFLYSLAHSSALACESQISRYSGQPSYSCACVPLPTTRPSSNT